MDNKLIAHFDLDTLLGQCNDSPEISLQQLLETYNALPEDEVCDNMSVLLLNQDKYTTAYKAFLAGFFTGIDAAWNRIEQGRPKLPE